MYTGKKKKNDAGECSSSGSRRPGHPYSTPWSCERAKPKLTTHVMQGTLCPRQYLHAPLLCRGALCRVSSYIYSVTSRNAKEMCTALASPGAGTIFYQHRAGTPHLFFFRGSCSRGTGSTQEDSGLQCLHDTISKQSTARAGHSPRSEQTHNSAPRYGFRGKNGPFSLRHVACFFYLTIVGWNRNEGYHAILE